MNGFAASEWERALRSLGSARQLRETDPDSAASRAYYAAFHAVSLKIRAGEDLATVRHFIQSEITLGRDRMCDIPVADETVSARHARLTYHHNQWWLEDLNSTNGTRLNQALITSPTVLTSEDEIDVGPTHVTVELATDESISATRRLTE